MYKPTFYVEDYEEGNQISDSMIETASDAKLFYNEFDTFTQAARMAKKVSEVFRGTYMVSVMMPSTHYRNGKEFDE